MKSILDFFRNNPSVVKHCIKGISLLIVSEVIFLVGFECGYSFHEIVFRLLFLLLAFLINSQFPDFNPKQKSEDLDSLNHI